LQRSQATINIALAWATDLQHELRDGITSAEDTPSLRAVARRVLDCVRVHKREMVTEVDGQRFVDGRLNFTIRAGEGYYLELVWSNDSLPSTERFRIQPGGEVTGAPEPKREQIPLAPSGNMKRYGTRARVATTRLLQGRSS
jgi:hypothetical protein